MGTRKNDKQVNYSHGPTQTKQQVGWCIVGTLLVHGWTTRKHKLTRLTMAQTWGQPPPSPLYYSLCLAMGLAAKCHFVSRLPSGSSEIPKIGTFATLGGHNLCVQTSRSKVVALVEDFPTICGTPPTFFLPWPMHITPFQMLGFMPLILAIRFRKVIWFIMLKGGNVHRSR
jgi:hypothetical protein